MSSSVKTVFQLDAPKSWFENVAARSDGTILATRLDAAELWSIDPRTGTGKPILSLDGVTGLTGVSELKPDVFALGAGDYDFATGTVPGSYGIWVADLRGTPTATKIVGVPEAGLLNGLATWDEDTVLTADSFHGKIYRVDIKTGTYSVALEDELMTPAVDAFLPIGVNGIKVAEIQGEKFVYFTSTTRESFCRVPVDNDIKPIGPYEVVASGFLQDDFDIAADGTAYVCTHPTNQIMKVQPGGESVKIAGDFTIMDVAGCTACAIGRGPGGGGVLYVVTSGANAVPVEGKSEPAKVVAVEI